MKDYQSLYAYNLHDNYMRDNYDKLYPSSSHIYNQSQLLEVVRSKYEFKEYKYKLYGKKAEKGICPSCRKKSCFLTCTRNDSDRYQLICADELCRFSNGKKSILLYEIPKHYGEILSLLKIENPVKEKQLPYDWKGIRKENRKNSQTL